jgi:regulator of sigma E protease
MNELTPDPLTSLGIIPYDPPIPLVIAAINNDSPAVQSDLKIGDKILAINHTPVKNWLEIVTFIQNHPDETFAFNLERDNKKIVVQVSIGHQRGLLLQKTGYLGISPAFKMPKELLQTIKYSPLVAFARAGKEIKDITYFNLILFGKMVTGKLSLESLGGPITIFETAGDAINYGFVAFIGFLAFLSLSIGIINFFQIPGLDGGHLFMQIIELIIRRPIPEKVQLVLFRLGFLFIILILTRALVNDILRLY